MAKYYFAANGASPTTAAQVIVATGGELRPCSMQYQRFGLHEQARMVQEFTRRNTCDECYVAIRSSLDKTFPRLLWENVGRSLSFRPRRVPEAVTAATPC